jgi:hypothetical protein
MLEPNSLVLWRRYEDMERMPGNESLVNSLEGNLRSESLRMARGEMVESSTIEVSRSSAGLEAAWLALSLLRNPRHRGNRIHRSMLAPKKQPRLTPIMPPVVKSLDTRTDRASIGAKPAKFLT